MFSTISKCKTYEVLIQEKAINFRVEFRLFFFLVGAFPYFCWFIFFVRLFTICFIVFKISSSFLSLRAWVWVCVCACRFLFFTAIQRLIRCCCKWFLKMALSTSPTSNRFRFKMLSFPLNILQTNYFFLRAFCFSRHFHIWISQSCSFPSITVVCTIALSCLYYCRRWKARKKQNSRLLIALQNLIMCYKCFRSFLRILFHLKKSFA